MIKAGLYYNDALTPVHLIAVTIDLVSMGTS